jgi:nitroreductase
MTTLDSLIRSRRSIRRYTAALPPEEDLQKMIDAARQAPSPSNRQPVRFIRVATVTARDVLHDAMRKGREALLCSVAETATPKRLRNWINAYFRFSEFMFDAPVLFAVGTSATSLSLAERLPGVGSCQGSEVRRRDLDISVGLALMGYLLKGEDLGLGSCVLTAPLFFIEKPEELLSLERTDIRCFIATGYPDEEPASIRRKTFTEIYREV